MGLFDVARRVFAGATPPAISDAMNRQGMTGATDLGPGSPLQPSHGYSTQPRSADYPIGVNTGVANRGKWGRTSYDLLRELMRSYSLATAAMNHKIDELRSMEPMFVPIPGAKGDTEEACDLARQVMAKPDQLHPWDEWASMWLTSLLTFDAGPLYNRRNMDGHIIGLEVLDGSTIYPYVNRHGRPPKPPAPAYQQVIKGQVRTLYTTEDIVFARFRAQDDSPFGMAPLESILVTAQTDMRFQWHLLQMFTDGSIPGGFMEVPPDVSSPDQVAEWQDYWDSMFMGDQSILHKLIAVPNASKFTGTAPAAFDSNFPDYLALQVCAAFGVVPQDLGYLKDVNRANGETQTDTQFRVNTLPWVRFIEGIMSRHLKRLGLPVEFKLNTGRDKEDRLGDAQAHKIYVEMGIESPDEAREELLGLPTDPLRPIPRGLILPRQGFVPFDSILAIAGKTNPETKSPTADAQLPYPYDGTPGLVPDKLPGGEKYKRAPLDPDDPAHPDAQAPVPGTGTVPNPSEAGTAQVQAPVRKKKHATPVAAGLAVVAGDTGRVLMTQRGHDEADPASDRWEFPGGHIEPGETPYQAALREWGEETGMRLPAGVCVGDWLSKDGGYVGHVYLIPHEGQLPQDLGAGRLVRGTDPGGDEIQAIAWFDPEDASSMKGTRRELKNTPWALIEDAPDEGRRSEVAKFAAFVKARRRSGKWRDFEFRYHTPAEASALNKGASPSDPKGWRAEPPNPTAYHSVDLALTDYWAPRVAAAIGAGVDAQSVAEDAVFGAWDAEDAASIDVSGAALRAVLIRLWADAHNTGVLAAMVTTGQDTSALTGWEPGHLTGQPADDSVAGAAWREAVGRAGITLTGIDDTTLTRIGAIIEDAVTGGSTVAQTARALNGFLADPDRAEMIAHTEIARLATNAGMAVYSAYGATQWDWVISAGACPICLDGASQNPHPLSEQGAIPAHPRCRCAASPHVEGGGPVG